MEETWDQKRKKMLGFMMKRFARPFELCLWPVRECGQEAIRAHSVQNSRVLDLLVDKGHVIMPRLDFRKTAPSQFVFEEVGRNQATTFTGLCGEHDQLLFAPIDTEPLDPTDQKQLFLLAYRSLLKEVHATRKTVIDHQLGYQKGIEEGLYPADTPCAPGMLAIEKGMSAFLVEDVKERYDEAYLSENWDRPAHHVIELDVGPVLAASSLFSTDRWAESTDAPAFVALNVIPTEEYTLAIFSYLYEQGAQIREAFDRICASSADFQMYELSKLLLRKYENFVLSPQHYRCFGTEQREMIREYFERNTCGHDYDQEHPSLNLFRPI
jgi:hypothetical protein